MKYVVRFKKISFANAIVESDSVGEANDIAWENRLNLDLDFCDSALIIDHIEEHDNLW
mgnify:FL=1